MLVSDVISPLHAHSYSRSKQPTIAVHPEDNKALEISDGVQTYWVGQLVRIVSGNTLIIHCNATGDPAPLYTWRSSSGKIKNGSSGIHIADNGTLTIAVVKTSDIRTLTCRAKNENGSDEKSSVIKVYGKHGNSLR